MRVTILPAKCSSRVGSNVTGASSWPRGLVFEPAKEPIRAIEVTKAAAMVILPRAYAVFYEAEVG